MVKFMRHSGLRNLILIRQSYINVNFPKIEGGFISLSMPFSRNSVVFFPIINVTLYMNNPYLPFSS